MTDDAIGGAMSTSAWHWAAKSGGVASPASGATGGPQWLHQQRTAGTEATRVGDGTRESGWTCSGHGREQHRNAEAEAFAERIGAFQGRYELLQRSIPVAVDRALKPVDTRS
jgi:hypothetical protein